MDKRYCPACGHELNNADKRGVTAFIYPESNKITHSCAMIECINFMLENGYIYYGRAKSGQRNTCAGDCA